MSQENHEEVFDIPGFCKTNKISRAFFYNLVKNGNGPRLMKVGRRTLITKEASSDWRKHMEEQTAQAATA